MGYLEMIFMNNKEKSKSDNSPDEEIEPVEAKPAGPEKGTKPVIKMLRKEDIKEE